MYISTNKSNYEYIRVARPKSKFFEPGPAVSFLQHESPWSMDLWTDNRHRRYPQECLTDPNASFFLDSLRNHNEWESPLINEMIM